MVKPTKPRWVSCSREASPQVARYRHLTLDPRDGWVTTLCGASGTPGALRGDSRKPECPACLERSKEECRAWYGDRDRKGHYCIRMAGHPEIGVDGIGHSDDEQMRGK